MYWECRCPSDGSCGCAGGPSEGLAGWDDNLTDLMTPPAQMSFGTGDALSTAAAMDPEPFSKMALYVASAFVKAWNTIEGWFGIGDGRREADVIVPVQNAIGERLAEIVSDQDRAGVTMLQDYYLELGMMALAFEKFLNDPQFTDGRASQQAAADILPLIANIQGGIAQRIRQRGGTIPLTPTVTQGAGYILPRLSNPMQTTFPAIPQAGTIWPNAPLPTIRSTGVQQVAGFDPISMLVIGGLALTLLKKGRR